MHAKGVHFHTFALKDELEVKAILRELPPTTDVELIKGELVARGFLPSYVSPLTRAVRGLSGRSRVLSNAFFCRFKTSAWTKILKELFGVTIEVTKFNTKPGPLQCASAFNTIVRSAMRLHTG